MTPDLGPNGQPLATSNPADEGPHECLWCGEDAADGYVVEVQKHEAEYAGKAVYGQGTLLCEKCNDDHIGSWTQSDWERSLDSISTLLGVDLQLEPFMRGDRIIEAVRKIMEQRDTYLEEAQRLTEEARRSDAGRVEVPEFDHNTLDIAGTWNSHDFRVFIAGAKEGHRALASRLSPSPQPATGAAQSLDDETVMYHAMSRWIERTPSCPSPMEGYIAGWQDRQFSPQPSANVVVVPRVEWSELRAFARISGFPEGRFSYEVPFEKDFAEWGTDIAHRLGITRDEEQAWLDALRSSTNHDAQDAGEGIQ